MLWPTLQAIKELGGSGTVSEILDKAVEIAGYTQEQQAMLHGAGPRTEIWYRMTWARSYLGAVGAAENSTRGIWSITDYGRSLTEEDMATIPPRVRLLSRQRRVGLTMTTATTEAGESPEEDPSTAEILERTATAGWRERLLSVLQAMDTTGFERLCQRLLRESDFAPVQVTGRSGDGGIDGIGVLRLGLLSFQVFFQCKRYKGSVGASAIRDFRGAMVGRTDKGLLITTGTFTPDARREATRDVAPVLELIDGDQLCELLKSKGLGVSTRQVEEVDVDAEWFERL